MLKLDAKFYGDIRKIKNDELLSQDEYMVFLAKDNAFALTLPVYRSICKALNADQEHLDAVDKTITRLEIWRKENADKCKTPDAKGEKLAY